MPQTVFQDLKYLKFDKYTKAVMKKWKTYTLEQQQKHADNWKRGRQKMEQLAQSYGMELKTPYPKFARMQDLDEIVWIKSKLPSGEELVWGIWKGEDHVLVKKDGKSKHVFNQMFLDYMTFGITNPEKANEKLAQMIVLFDGAELKRGQR